MAKISNLWKFHKKLSVLLIIVLASTAYGSVKILQNVGNVPKYTLAEAANGTIIDTVTGTGQVAASNEIDLNNNVTGTVEAVDATAGQKVTAGTTLVEIDPSSALISLQNAQIALAKLQEPPDPTQLTQDQNSLSNAESSKASAETSGISAVSNSYIDMASIISGLNGMFNTKGGYLTPQETIFMDTTAQADVNQAGASFDIANTEYQKSFQDYNNSRSQTDATTTDNIIEETYNTANDLAKAIQYTKAAVDYIENNDASKEVSTDTTASETNLGQWTSTINSDLSNLQNANDTIQSNINTIQQDSVALQELVKGTDPLDIQSAELNVETAQKNYDNYFVKAPLDGVVANISVQQGDQASGSVGTFITTEKIANVSLNEVDAAKVAAGDKVTLTFDAVPDLSIAGTVTQVDLIGTVSQGVVTFNVQIGFDTDDTRVKPGMSVDASIITDVHQNVITIPSSAIKTQGNTSYVQMFSSPIPKSEEASYPSKTAPKTVVVQTGATDDTNTEITSGLKVGDQVVTKVVNASTQTTSTQTPSLLSSLGARGGGAAGGGGFRGGAGGGAGARG